MIVKATVRGEVLTFRHNIINLWSLENPMILFEKVE